MFKECYNRQHSASNNKIKDSKNYMTNDCKLGIKMFQQTKVNAPV